jgi:hypothetical protein
MVYRCPATGQKVQGHVADDPIAVTYMSPFADGLILPTQLGLLGRVKMKDPARISPELYGVDDFFGITRL